VRRSGGNCGSKKKSVQEREKVGKNLQKENNNERNKHPCKKNSIF
jgi:hypothetical protein